MAAKEENIQRIREMESILSKAAEKMDALEKAIAEYEAILPAIGKLEAYYTGREWKEDLALDEAGELPADLRRGVLSEDGIWNALERNRELAEKLRK